MPPCQWSGERSLVSERIIIPATWLSAAQPQLPAGLVAAAFRSLLARCSTWDHALSELDSGGALHKLPTSLLLQPRRRRAGLQLTWDRPVAHMQAVKGANALFWLGLRQLVMAKSVQSSTCKVAQLGDPLRNFHILYVCMYMHTYKQAHKYA